MKFQIRDPHMKVLLPAVYESREEIPARVLNNWDVWIEVTPENIVEVNDSEI
jgi:hypothetical protein